LAVTRYVTATPGVPTATVYLSFVYTALLSVAPGWFGVLVALRVTAGG